MAKKSTKKSETPVKPPRTRIVRSRVGQVVAALARVVDGDRKAAEATRKRAALFGAQIQKLIYWGKAKLAMGPDEAYDLAIELQREGFEPPKGPTARGFVEGDPVKLREKFAAEYLKVYLPATLSAMVFRAADPVTGTVICSSGTDQVLTRMAHIERRLMMPGLVDPAMVAVQDEAESPQE